MGDPFRTFELRISLAQKKRVPILLDHLEGLSISRDEIVLTEYKTKTNISYFDKNRSKILRISKRVLACPGSFKIKILTLNREDWMDKWQLSYRPFSVGKTFRIIPAWIKERERTSRHLLRIDPGAAFGSGLHETTRLSLLLMESLRESFKDQLDLGTGTGILSVAGFKMGAQAITAMDLDPLSTDAAKKNLKMNGCHFAKIQTLDLSRWKSKKRFDLVSANLHSSALIEFKKKILTLVRPSKYLIVSGILKRDKTSFLKSFHDARFRKLKALDGRSWTAILYQKHSFLTKK